MVKGRLASAYLRLATSGGELVKGSRKCPRAGRRRVHSKQVVRGNDLTFRLGCGDDSSPGILGDSVTLLPFLDRPVTLADGLGKLSRGAQAIDEKPDGMVFGFGLHDPECATDELSVQGRTTDPVTRKPRRRTICPMGRGTTEADFLNVFCERTRSARVMAGFDDYKEFADKMGIQHDTYLRYETRTPLPHRYIPRFLQLTGASADILFTGKRIEHRKTG